MYFDKKTFSENAMQAKNRIDIDVINNNRIDAKYHQMAFRSVPTRVPTNLVE